MIRCHRAPLIAVAGAFASWVFAAAPAVAAGKTPTIAILETMTLSAVQARTAALRRHLEARGFRDGDNLRTIVLNAEGEQRRGETLMRAALKESNPDLVVSNATLASKAVKNLLAGSDIPQVFMLVGDPVGAGLVPAIGKPSGANITGTTHLLPARQKVELLATMAATRTSSSPLRIALVHSSYPSAVSDFREISEFGRGVAGLDFTGVKIAYAPDSGATYKASVRSMAAEAVEKLKAAADDFDVFWICNGPNAINKIFLETLRDQVAKPMIFANNLTGVELGGLFTVFSSAETNGRDTANMVAAVLAGADAGTIPVSRPNKFDIAINVSTAAKLGLVVPAEILELAGDFIYR